MIRVCRYFMAVALLALAGCAVKPVAISEDEHALRIAEDQRRVFEEQDELKAPLTLDQAIARALRWEGGLAVEVRAERGHARRTAMEPSRPLGRTISVNMMTTKAETSRKLVPM